MDYEEKYKNTLERAKVIYQGSYKPDTAATIAETLQSIFPELIESKDESEDERIRKELIEFLVGKRIIGNDLEGVNIDKTLVWLEKQGQKDPCDHRNTYRLRI